MPKPSIEDPMDQFNLKSLSKWLRKCWGTFQIFNYQWRVALLLLFRPQHWLSSQNVNKLCCWIFLKTGQPRLLSHLFSSFQTQITIFTTNKYEKSPSSIWCRDSKSQPLKHESPTITTIPGLPPFVADFSCWKRFGWNHFTVSIPGSATRWWNKKLLNFFQHCPRSSQIIFYIKVLIFKIALKFTWTFGLLL